MVDCFFHQKIKNTPKKNPQQNRSVIPSLLHSHATECLCKILTSDSTIHFKHWQMKLKTIFYSHHVCCSRHLITDLKASLALTIIKTIRFYTIFCDLNWTQSLQAELKHFIKFFYIIHTFFSQCICIMSHRNCRRISLNSMYDRSTYTTVRTHNPACGLARAISKSDI